MLLGQLKGLNCPAKELMVLLVHPAREQLKRNQALGTPLAVVSCPDYPLHAEGKNSLVNCLFNFCSVCHDGGAPIRLLYANDVTYCDGW